MDQPERDQQSPGGPAADQFSRKKKSHFFSTLPKIFFQITHSTHSLRPDLISSLVEFLSFEAKRGIHLASKWLRFP